MIIVNNYVCNFIAILNYSIYTNRFFCRIPYRKVGEQLCSLLFKHGYILSYRCITYKNKDYIYVMMKCVKNINPLYQLKMISRPGSSIYWTVNKLTDELSSGSVYTQYVISTPKGILLSNVAVEKQIGGK